jgi:hypothetical protein
MNKLTLVESPRIEKSPNQRRNLHMIQGPDIWNLHMAPTEPEMIPNLLQFTNKHELACTTETSICRLNASHIPSSK